MLSMPRYITRLTSKDYAFNGFRVAITRMKKNFIRYFSDLEHGGEYQAFCEAVQIRDAILAELCQHPDNPEAVFSRFRKPPLDLPPGLHPLLKPIKEVPLTCTLRCSGKMAIVQTRLCNQFQLDRSSILKLALYCLMATLGQEELQGLGLRQLLSFMESLRQHNDPCWPEFVGTPPLKKGKAVTRKNDL